MRRAEERALTPWANFNQIYPKLNIPVRNRSVRASSRDGNGSRPGWEWIPSGVGAELHEAVCPGMARRRRWWGVPEVCQPGPRLSRALGARTPRSARIRRHTDFLSQREKIRGDLSHVKRITAAAAGTVPVHRGSFTFPKHSN